MPSKVDISQVLVNLDKLANPDMRESLARKMAVEGGVIYRDEAKKRAPVNSQPGTANQYPVKRGKGGNALGAARPASGSRPGQLRDSIYLAYRDAQSTQSHVVYSVTWNAKKAPHGHLAEFGHRQYFVVRKDLKGRYYTTNERLPQPKIILGKGFLGATYESTLSRVQAAMIERGRKELPNLLSGGTNGTGNGSTE